MNAAALRITPTVEADIDDLVQHLVQGIRQRLCSRGSAAQIRDEAARDVLRRVFEILRCLPGFILAFGKTLGFNDSVRISRRQLFNARRQFGRDCNAGLLGGSEQILF